MARFEKIRQKLERIKEISDSEEVNWLADEILTEL